MPRRLLLALLLLLSVPAQAVLIDSGDGTGNTTAPSDDPGFAHVGSRGALSVVYVGYGWVLAAAHVGLGDVVIGGVTYPALSGSRIVLTNSGTTQADLELFRIQPAPPLDPLPIRASVPAVNDSVIMIGNGRNRGDAVSVFPPPSVDDGYYWGAGRTIRWGTNVVQSIDPNLTIGSLVTDSFGTSFSRNGTAHEAQAANGDSGGAVFIKNAGTWELAGVMYAIAVYAEQVGDLAETALYGNLTYAADLSQYRSDILDIITPDCGNGYLTIDEECDDGNTEAGDCCSPSCQYEPDTTECRAGAGDCDVADYCNGAGACDPDAFEPPGTACGDPGDTLCDDPDSCDAAGTCLANYEPPTTECRAPAGVCDAPDYCDGASAACPADAKLTTECRASTQVCDAAEMCDGVSDDCGRDMPANGQPCPDGDLCNGDEVCVGWVCRARPPLVCDDGDACTNDRCDAIQGCVNDPIVGGICAGADLPSASRAGRLLLALLLVGAGAAFLARRRGFAA